MTHQLTENQFLTQFQDTDFVLKTQAQIVKDFERSGHETAPELSSSSLNLEQITTIVAEMLANVMKMGEGTTLQLLYQIDIPQGQFLVITTDPDFLTKAAQLIIRREAQKVYLRSLF